MACAFALAHGTASWRFGTELDPENQMRREWERERMRNWEWKILSNRKISHKQTQKSPSVCVGFLEDWVLLEYLNGIFNCKNKLQQTQEVVIITWQSHDGNNLAWNDSIFESLKMRKMNNHLRI